jgi:DNA polymerase-3 subunit beta
VDKGKVDVTSSKKKKNEEQEQHPLEYSGPALTISFNAQYVLDFLNVVETDVVSLSLKDDVSQAVMKPVGAQGYDYTYVIMPMRI